MVDLPEGMENFINDYKIHIFEVAYLTEEQVKLFRSDFRIVADYFVQKIYPRKENDPACGCRIKIYVCYDRG